MKYTQSRFSLILYEDGTGLLLTFISSRAYNAVYLLKGGNAIISECVNCNNTRGTASIEDVDGSCPAIGYQRVGVCVPVTVTPFAHAEPTKTKCCGEPSVVFGDASCAGKKNGVCTFTISQTICIEVPVRFGATAAVGDTYVDCLGASTDDICTNCKDKEVNQ